MISRRVRALTALASGTLLLAALPATPAWATSAIVTVKVTGKPTGIVITPDSSRAYVSNAGTDTVNVINVSSGALAANIPVCSNPQPPAISGDGAKVVVACNGDDKVQVISTATNTVTATIAVGDSPGKPLVSGSRAYVSNFGGNSVSVIDLISNAVVATIPVGAGPTTGILGTGDQYQSYGTTLFVPNGSGGTISLVDTNTSTVTSTSTIGGQVTGAAVSPGMSGWNAVFVSSATYSSVVQLSQTGGAPIQFVSVGSNPSVPTVNIDGSRVFVANGGSKSVSVVSLDASPAKVVATVPVGSTPGNPVMDKSGASIYVPNYGGSTVSVISTSTNAVKATYQVGNGPMGIAIAPSGSKMLSANSKDGTVSVVTLSSSTLAKAPTSVSVNLSTSKQATISWKASTSSSVTGYVVTALPGGATCSTTSTKCTIKGLTGGKSYKFAVQTKNKYGSGAPATSKSVTIKK
jgi:YVTN family beta-propeller protein